VIRVKISLTYRAVPYCVELEGSDKTDVDFLLSEALGSVIEAVHRFINDCLKACESEG
jgi:hypothetical protein